VPPASGPPAAGGAGKPAADGTPQGATAPGAKKEGDNTVAARKPAVPQICDLTTRDLVAALERDAALGKHPVLYRIIGDMFR
jgi:hypothetical protein